MIKQIPWVKQRCSLSGNDIILGDAYDGFIGLEQTPPLLSYGDYVHYHLRSNFHRERGLARYLGDGTLARVMHFGALYAGEYFGPFQNIQIRNNNGDVILTPPFIPADGSPNAETFFSCEALPEFDSFCDGFQAFWKPRPNSTVNDSAGLLPTLVGNVLSATIDYDAPSGNASFRRRILRTDATIGSCASWLLTDFPIRFGEAQRLKLSFTFHTPSIEVSDRIFVGVTSDNTAPTHRPIISQPNAFGLGRDGGSTWRILSDSAEVATDELSLAGSSPLSAVRVTLDCIGQILLIYIDIHSDPGDAGADSSTRGFRPFWSSHYDLSAMSLANLYPVAWISTNRTVATEIHVGDVTYQVSKWP